MNKIFEHFKLITKHKWYVFKHCCKAHLFRQGLTHDLSKYSPTEFFESVKYYNGKHSPIDECKSIKGYSLAWLHHKGKNKHHFEYYIDNINGEQVAIQMPYKYALELICDYLGAGQAYSKSKINKRFYINEYEWWVNKSTKPLAFHPQTKNFVSTMLRTMAKEGSNDCLRPFRSKYIYYNLCLREYEAQKRDFKKVI